MTDKTNEEEYFKYLIKSFELNKNSPGVLLTLGEVFLHKNEHERAENVAKRALEVVDSMSKKDDTRKDLKILKSNLLVLLGKLVHSKSDYNKAFKFYEDAVHTYDSNPIALHFLGMMNLHLRNYAEAEKNFEKALKITKVDKDKTTEYKPQNIETMKVLAQTKARMYKRDETMKLLDTILENDRTDTDSYLLAAYLTEQNDYKKAIHCYTKAIEILEKKFEKMNEEKDESSLTEKDFISPVYYNNLAVLYMKMEKSEEANEMIIKARKILKSLRTKEPNNTHLKSLSIILYFNEACQYEALGEIGKATNNYKYIIKEEPYYVDAYLRLAILAQKRGSLGKAIDYANKGVKQTLDRKPVVPY